MDPPPVLPLGAAEGVGDPGASRRQGHLSFRAAPQALAGGVVEHCIGQDPEYHDGLRFRRSAGQADRDDPEVAGLALDLEHL